MAEDTENKKKKKEAEFTQDEMIAGAKLKLMLDRKWEEGFREALVQVCRNPGIPKAQRDRLGFAIGSTNKRIESLDKLASEVNGKTLRAGKEKTPNEHNMAGSKEG